MSLIKINKLKLSITVVAFIGIVDTILIYLKSVGASVSCVVFSGCDSVLNSRFASLFGIHLVFYGAVFYVTIIVLTILLSKYNLSMGILLSLSYIGAGFSTYLMFLQLFVLKNICSYCSISFILSFTIFFLVLYLSKYIRHNYKHPNILN